MIFSSQSLTQSVKLFLTGLFICFLSANTGVAQQSQSPFSLDLNLGGGLIGNPDVKTAFQPELGFRFQPGKWGFGLESSFFSFDPSYSAEQYRSGFEEYTEVQKTADKWNAFNINAGPRFQFGEQLPVQFSVGLDLALSYKNPPAQSVEFNDPEGPFDGAALTIAKFEPENGYSKWSAAIRPQLQLEINPFRSNRIGFNLKTGIQHELSDREFTYTERDLSSVQQVPSAREMFFQFENAPELERTVSAPKTNFFANAGIKIRFGGSKTPAQDYNAARSNKPTSRAEDIGDGDMDSDDDAIETAQDYNSSRSNKPSTIADGTGGGDEDMMRKAALMARMANPAVTIITLGGITAKGKKPLYKVQINDGGSDNNNNDYPTPVQRYDLQPSSYCVSLSGVSDQVLKTFFETGDKPSSLAQESGDLTEQDSDSTARVIPPSIAGVEVTSPTNLKPDTDQDGFPEVMKNASFSISKRSARTGRSQNPIHEEGGTMQTNPMYESEEMATGNGGDMDADAEGFHFELEINDMRSRVSEVISRMESDSPDSRADSSSNAPPGVHVAPSQTKVIIMGVTDNGDITPLEESKLSEFDFSGDPDSDDDGLMDAIESATYSISKRSARTGRSASSGGKETGSMEWNEKTNKQMASDDDPCGPGVWARTTGGNENCSPENSGQENPLARESGWQEATELDVAPPNDVYQWTYTLNELSSSEELLGNGILTVLFTEGNWHFDVQLDPDDDGDGYGDLIQNSSFSISKR
jgi:hypothetical protein